MGECEHMESVGAYHDGELHGDALRAFEAHLSHCVDCARELKALRKLSALLTGADIPDAPPRLLEQLGREAAAAPERVVMRMMEVLTVAAAIMFIVCCGWVWAGLGESPEVPTGLPAWEQTAVSAPMEAAANETEEVALWIVADLSLENGHD